MEFAPTRLPEVVLIKPRIFGDARGFFFESWHEQKFAAAGIAVHFVQDNHSHSTRYTLRGLHFQIQQPQGKLVRVTRGEVFDVAVDIRRSSPRFGQWVGVVLSEANHYMLWVPPGFAHGYLALSEQIDFLYKCTDFYAPEHERAIRWDDPELGVQWPRRRAWRRFFRLRMRPRLRSGRLSRTREGADHRRLRPGRQRTARQRAWAG